MVKNEVYKIKKLSIKNLHHLISERSLLFFIENTNFNKNKYFQLEKGLLCIFMKMTISKKVFLKIGLFFSAN
jgi:hypothetical protein